MIKLGLAGFGQWGRKYVHAAQQTEICDVTTVCTRNINLSIPLNLDTVNNVDDLLNSGVDGVIIATPPDSHHEIANKCLDRGIPFLLEKPISLDQKECRDLISKAKHLNQPFQVNHVHLYSKAYLKLREIVLDWRSNGYELLILSKGGNNGPIRNYDSFLDYAPHDISMILGLVDSGEYQEIVPHNIKAKTDRGCINKLFLSGTRFQSTSWVGNGFESKCRTLDVFNQTTGDHISYTDSYPTFKVELNGMRILVIQDPPLESSLVAFCDLIQGKTDWRNDHIFNQNICDLMFTANL